MTRFVVGLDGSENSSRAAAVAARLARDCGGSILAVHAVGLLERLGPAGGRRSIRLVHQEIESTMTSAWCAPFSGLDLVSRVVDGNPITVLLDAADRSDDVIVVGRRGAGHHAGSALGSTSAQVVERSHRPVLVVPD
ncbi:MAG: universal stress protein [Actinomycetota bacterium]